MIDFRIICGDLILGLVHTINRLIWINERMVGIILPYINNFFDHSINYCYPLCFQDYSHNWWWYAQVLLQRRPLSSGDKTGGGGRCFWSHTHRTDGSLAAVYNVVSSISVFHCDAMGQSVSMHSHCSFWV